MKRIQYALFAAVFLTPLALGQDNSSPPPLYPTPGNPAETQSQQNVANQQNSQTPVFRVNVYARSAKAVNYRHRGGSTTLDIKGTSIEPEITGRAKVDGKAGRLAIDVELNHMQRPTKFGPQYLTYVLWAVTPEGRAVNLGEVLPSGDGKDKLSVTTDLQAFGLFVTAEPYFAVIHPSEVVVAENQVLPGTKGFEEPIDAKFDVLEGKEYTIDVPVEQLPSTQAQPNVPLDLLESRNAVAIAKAAGAEQYANDSLMKAEDMLQRAEDYYQRKQGRTPIGTAARGATQMAEDARVLTLRKKEQEREESARRAAAEAEVAGRGDERLTEVVHPDAVDQDAGRQRVVRGGDRAGQVEPAAAPTTWPTVTVPAVVPSPLLKVAASVVPTLMMLEVPHAPVLNVTVPMLRWPAPILRTPRRYGACWTSVRESRRCAE